MTKIPEADSRETRCGKYQITMKLEKGKIVLMNGLIK